MEVYVTDDEIGRYFRRLQLGLRFLAHGARTMIVSEWSGLTPDQLKTQRHRWGFGPDDRQYGPARTSFKKFFEPARRADEFSLLASIQRIVGFRVMRSEAGESVLAPSLENGERACDAFEIFREWKPESSITFEESLRLAEGVVSGTEVELAGCGECGRALLHYKLGRVEEDCLRCRRLAGRSRRRPG